MVSASNDVMTRNHTLPVSLTLCAGSVDDHDDVIKWKLFPCYWPFARGIHRSPVNSPHKGPATRSFDVSLMLTRANS